MQIEWDEAKRQSNLEKHGLDLADAYKIFEGPTWEFEDERFDYPETRVITIGFLGGLLVAVLVWTGRDSNIIRVISIRKATKYEELNYYQQING